MGFSSFLSLLLSPGPDCFRALRTATQQNNWKERKRKNCANKEKRKYNMDWSIKSIILKPLEKKLATQTITEQNHSISERFVLQKGYRMNHCQVTLNTDQRTTSDGESFQRIHNYPENLKFMREKNKNKFHTYEDVKDSKVEAEELSRKSIPCSCYYKPNHIGVHRKTQKRTDEIHYWDHTEILFHLSNIVE